jgi:hypothetical protein
MMRYAPIRGYVYVVVIIHMKDHSNICPWKRLGMYRYAGMYFAY